MIVLQFKKLVVVLKPGMSVLVNFALDKPTLIKCKLIGYLCGGGKHNDVKYTLQFAAVPALGERNTLNCICPSAVIKLKAVVKLHFIC